MNTHGLFDALLGAWYLAEEYIDRPPGELKLVKISALRLADVLYFGSLQRVMSIPRKPPSVL